jgi:hypothetical protein
MADNATISRGIYEAFARGDIAAVLGALHEQAEWNEAEHFTLWPGGPVIGPQAVLLNGPWRDQKESGVRNQESGLGKVRGFRSEASATDSSCLAQP